MKTLTHPDVSQIPGVMLGEIVGVDKDGRPLVRWQGRGSRPAQPLWTSTPPKWSDCVGCRVALALVDGDARRPLIVGLLDAPRAAPIATMPSTLKVESRDELVIECGKSKIALRADGRIEIRGGHLVSRSSGPNKVKGGSVHIN